MLAWMRMLAVAVLVAAEPAAAQDYDRQVRGYLEHGLAAHAVEGYAPERTVPDLIVPLQLDRPFLWSVFLRQGVAYRVYGACDDNCSDLDMEIYGADGRLVDRDAAPDDTPYVQLTPSETGRHYVRLWLYACTAGSCYVAARVVSGGQPAPRPAPP